MRFRPRIRFGWALQESAVRWAREFLLSAAVGVLSGIAAIGLHYGLEEGTQHVIGRHLPSDGFAVFEFKWAIVALPCLGGLLGGLVVRLLNRGDLRQGTNLFIDAFHRQAGNLPLRGPLSKGLAAVGVISAGGAAGPEGPIAALGAAIGSKLARRLSLTPRDRRTLLVAGCAGGIGAIFQCPLGGAFFAASVLYREPELEARSIVPAFIASVISYSTFMLSPGFGHRMLEGADRLAFSTPLELLPYAVLAVVCAALCAAFSCALRIVESRPLRRLRLPLWLAPALGGLLVGLLACALPQVMDARYRFVQMAVDTFGGRLAAQLPLWELTALFAAVAVGKCVATALTVGSGAPGGVLGPSVYIGGMGGAFVAALTETLTPGVFPAGLAPSLVPVGMAGVLAAAMRTPMAALVMVTEMTGSYGLIVPLMFVTVTSYVLGRRWGLNRAQVSSSAESPAHAGDLLVNLLETLRVEDLMIREWPYVASPATTLGDMIRGVPSGARPVYAVLEGGRFEGLVTLPQIGRVFSEPSFLRMIIAADIMVERCPTVHPQDRVYAALEHFRGGRWEVVPVISGVGDREFVGMLSRQAIHLAVRNRMDEIRDNARREHVGLGTVEHDDQLFELELGISPPRRGAIQRIPVPVEAVGQSLRQTDFRRRFAIVVLGIQSPGGALECPPDIDAPLTADQSLLVIAEDEQHLAAPQGNSG